MKYIRTEGDKIVAYDENAPALEKPTILFYKGKYREADNVEELFDAFVVAGGPYRAAYVARTLSEAIEYCSNNRVSKTKIRGAIWTGKGLIYVAEMNQERKWRLL